MNSKLRRLVLLTCGLAVVTQIVACRRERPSLTPRVVCPQAKQDRPSSIHVTVDSKAITAKNSGTDPRTDRVWAVAGGNATFEIENLDSVVHRVKIPVREFTPKDEYKDPKRGGLATRDPLEPGQKDEIDVAPRSVGRLVLRVKPKDSLFNRPPWDANRCLSMTYKFNIHSVPGGREPIHLDPDLEVDQP